MRGLYRRAKVSGDVRQRDCYGNRGEEEEADDPDPGEGGEIAGGEGAEALGVVAAVGLDVEEVVDDIGGGGAEAEGEERQDNSDCRAEGVGGFPAVGEEEGQEDEGIFGPLVQPDGLEPCFVGGLQVSKDPRRNDFGAVEASHERAGRVRDHGLDADGKDGDIGAGVADVGELIAKFGTEGG